MARETCISLSKIDTTAHTTLLVFIKKALAFPTLLDTVTRSIQCPAPYIHPIVTQISGNLSKNDFIASWNTVWYWNKATFFTLDPNGTGIITVSGPDMPRTERFKYLMVNCASTSLGWRTGGLCKRCILHVTHYGFECWSTIEGNERGSSLAKIGLNIWVDGNRPNGRNIHGFIF